MRLRSHRYRIYTASIDDTRNEIDIGLDAIEIDHPYTNTLEVYLIESFWRLQTDMSEIANAIYLTDLADKRSFAG